MPPTLALIVWLVLLLALLYLDPARISETSVALWVPVTWIFFVASRLPSQWLGSEGGEIHQILVEGNSLDRSVDLVLIVMALVILVSRLFGWGRFFARNAALMVFLMFALVSLLWSDFPFVAFKRWFRDLGNYIMILVVLTDQRPLEAIRTVARRLCFLLIPLSILLIKYFSLLGRQYTVWQGTAMYTGATTSKNMLGAVCLMSGLFFFWDTVTRWPERNQRKIKQILAVNFALFGMTL